MRKEILVAVMIGLAMGLIITYGFYQARTTLSQPEQTPIITINNNGDMENEIIGNLTIISPADESVQRDSNVLITGNTQANNYVVIFINDEDIITTADEVGNFTIDAQLQNGSNVITVNSIDEGGNTTKKTLTVIVTQEALLEEELFLSNDENSSPSAELTEGE